MLNRIAPVLCLPAFVFAAGLITHDYSFNTPQVINDAVFIEGCANSTRGFAPELAERPVTLLLPDGCEAASYTVECGNPVTLKGSYSIRPFRPDVGPEQQSLHKNADILRSPLYKKNEYYPKSADAGWFRMQYQNGHPLFISALNPVRYNPVTGTISYYKTITVKVALKAIQGLAKSSGEPQMPVRTTGAIKDLIADQVDNKIAAAKLALTTNTDSTYEYLIITSTTLQNNFANFIAFNRRRGLRTNVVTWQAIKADGTITGADSAAKMRAFIKREYTNHNITYVLLAGSCRRLATDLPVRQFRSYFYDCWVAPERYTDHRDIVADIYYSTLDGTWKDSAGVKTMPYYGDPGTEDMTWEVYATRWPVETATDLSNIINKTIMYSETPVASQWNKLFLAGNYLWTESGKPAVYGDDYSEEYYHDSCTTNNYTTYGYQPSQWTVTRLYDRTATWTGAQCIATFKSFRPHIFEHEGHGNFTSAANMTTSDLTTTNFDNNGTNANFFHMWTGACDDAGFDYTSTCFQAKFLNIATGAVTTMGFTRLGMEDDNNTDGVGQRLRRFQKDAIFRPTNQIHYFEEAMAYAKSNPKNRYKILDPNITHDTSYFGMLKFVCYGLHDFGDPAISIWTALPTTLSVTPSINTAGVFTVQTGRPWSWVAVCDINGNIINSHKTGFNGADTMSETFLRTYFSAHPGASLKVFIKAKNALPCSTLVTVPTTVIAGNKQAIALINSTKIVTAKNRLDVSYNLEKPGMVNIALFNAKGALIKTISNGMQTEGRHAMTFDVADVGRGIYYFKLKAGSAEYTTDVLFVK